MKEFFDRDIHLGILKGGQLGRMLLQPCMNFGIIPHCMDIDPQAPVKQYCPNFSLGNTNEFKDVYSFGKDLDAVTLEFEHVNIDALRKLKEDGVQVYPDPDIIAIVQDKGIQKKFYADHNIPTSDFRLIESRDEIAGCLKEGGAVQKKRVAGYDGKGVYVISGVDDISGAFDEPSVLEDKVDIQKEISVMVARNRSGQVETYPTVEMVFHEGANMLDYLISPAQIEDTLEARAEELARMIAEKLKLVGILAVEMFLSTDGEILVNEIAPRPHNSGHHTIESNSTSQFNQHIRAIFDLPLGGTSTFSPAAMVNIVGEPGHDGPVKYQGITKFMNMPGVYLHLYGKKITRPFRKMGHVTIVRQELPEAIEIAQHVKAEVKAVSCQKSSSV